MGGVGEMISGSGAKSARRAQRAAELRAAEQLKREEAVQLRATLDEDKRAEKVGEETAALVRTSAARRSGRNALSFLPVGSGLKSTLGA